MRKGRVFVGAAVLVTTTVLVFLLWEGRKPERPANLPANAIYIERGVVPFKIRSTPGNWVGCWFDEVERVDRCRVTNENGWQEFEDVFLPYKDVSPVPERDLKLDRKRTGTLWFGRVPVIYLANGEILLARTNFDEARRRLQ